MQPMIIHDLDDLVLDRDDDAGIEELGRATLSEGPWTTVAYLVRTRSGSDAPWNGPCLWLHRYQKVRGGWKLSSRFQMTEAGQMTKLLEALKNWQLV
jgi:hypothetical protein